MNFCMKMLELGVVPGTQNRIRYVTPTGFHRIRGMIDGYGCDPRSMSEDVVADVLGIPSKGRMIFMKNSFECLLNVGFRLDHDHFVLVDPADYPCLQAYNWEMHDFLEELFVI